MHNCECNSVPMFVQQYSHIPYKVILFLDYMELYLEINFLNKYVSQFRSVSFSG